MLAARRVDRLRARIDVWHRWAVWAGVAIEFDVSGVESEHKYAWHRINRTRTLINAIETDFERELEGYREKTRKVDGSCHEFPRTISDDEDKKVRESVSRVAKWRMFRTNAMRDASRAWDLAIEDKRLIEIDRVRFEKKRKSA